MPRPQKKPPNRADGRWEVKKTVGKDDFLGKPIRKSFYSAISKDDAEQQANDYIIKMEAYKLIGDTLISREATFKEWATTWLEKYKEGKVKESTYDETYKRTVDSYLTPYFGEKKINLIREADIQTFVKKYNIKYSESVMHKMRLCLNGIFESAIDNQLCRANPAKKVAFDSMVDKSPKHTYSQDEVDSIYKYCWQHPTGIYIRILLELGLRCSELCGLTWGDFDFKNRTVHIQKATTRVKNKATVCKTKSEKSNRVLPLSTKLITMLEPLKENDDDFLLSSTNKITKGKPLSPLDFSSKRYKTFFKNYKKYLYEDYQKRLQTDKNAKLVEIKELTPHELRHTCGTLLYARTKDIYAVSKYLGHSSVEITARLYVHESPELLRANLGIN